MFNDLLKLILAVSLHFLIAQSPEVKTGHSTNFIKPMSFHHGCKFFSKRVVDVWNSLSDSIVTLHTVQSFERCLVAYDLTKFNSL